MGGEIEFDAGGRCQEKGKKKKVKGASGGFQSMGLSFHLLKGVLKRGYQIPTPIQRKTIPMVLQGKDVVGMARTGSGKTAAFLIPLLEKLCEEQEKTEIGEKAAKNPYPRALILSPTRELALQTFTFANDLSRYLPTLKIARIVGGESMENQFELLHTSPHLLIATPGRFMHLCVEMELNLTGVRMVVFDEADRLFEMGFGEQLGEIIARLSPSRQTLLFSATLPKALVDFTRAGLNDPVLIRLDMDKKLSANLGLVYLGSRSEDKVLHLLYILKNVIDVDNTQTLVFVATRYHVDYLHHVLTRLGISNTYIYSSLDASARKISLDKFRSRKANVLVVTDLAARGLDIPLLDNVINFHFPSKPKLFLHRVGRVARAGNSGTSYSIVSPDEIAYLLDLHLFLSKPLSIREGSEGDVLGRLPQEFIDIEGNSIKNLQSSRWNELEDLWRVCKNGYLAYLKSRPAASVESNRRAKGLLLSNLPIHPTLFPDQKPDPINTFIQQIHNFRPKSTIFEIGGRKKGKSVGTETEEMMKVKRQRDEGAITKFRENKREEAEAHATSKDKEHFINYLPLDHDAETGYSVGSSADFRQEIQSSMMDMTGDDKEGLKSQKFLLKWDNKKKKFVRGNEKNSDESSRKKIKTESGAWISSSYKSNRYKVWKNKSKVDHTEEGESDEEKKSGRGEKFSSKKRPLATFPNNGGRKRPFRTEIKKPEAILKQRRLKEAKSKRGKKTKSNSSQQRKKRVGKRN